jgi:hypothetical protein
MAAGPATRPVDVDALVGRLESADYAERVEASWALVKAYRRQGEEIEAASRRPDLGPQAAMELRQIVATQKPRLAARRRRDAVAAEADRANREAALASYEACGKHDPAWDATAREFLRVYGRHEEDPGPEDPPVAGPTPELDGLIAALRQAHCDDALVLYFVARVEEHRPGVDAEAVVTAYRTATAAMEASKYPASRKCFAHARHVQAVMRWEQWGRYRNWKATMGKHLDQALAYWPAAMREPAMTDLAAGDLARVLEYDWLRVKGKAPGRWGDRGALCAKLLPAWQAAFPKAVGPLVFEGRLYAQYAWDALGRGGGVTKALPDAGQQFDGRMKEARAALEAAYAADPTDPRAATEMLVVLIGERAGRDEMETWWGRAMEADPDDYNACWLKMSYLGPRAMGSATEMIRFGRECVSGGNWEGRLPFILVDAHVRLAGYETDPDAYFTGSPDVWRDIRSVFEPYLMRYPRSVRDRSNYAYHAARCGQWEVARRQFEILGDDPDLESFGTRDAYEYLRRRAKNGGRP